MSKPENLGLIVFLSVLVMCLCTLLFWMLLKFAIQDGERTHDRRQNQKATALLREEREKFEKVLKAIPPTE